MKYMVIRKTERDGKWNNISFETEADRRAWLTRNCVEIGERWFTDRDNDEVVLIKEIGCVLFKSSVCTGVWICGITDTEAIMDADKEDCFVGGSEEDALNRANKKLNPLGYMVVRKES